MDKEKKDQIKQAVLENFEVEESIREQYEIDKSEAVPAALRFIAEQFSTVKITDWQNQDEIDNAEKKRRVLVRLRNNIDKLRKVLKAESLETGRAIDATAKELAAIIAPTEAAIQSELDKAAAEKAGQELREHNIRMMDARKAELQKLNVEISDDELLEISQADYDLTVQNAKDAIVAEAQRQRDEAERKAREEARQKELQQAREEAAREEREKIQREQQREVVTDQGTIHKAQAADPEAEFENYIERLLSVSPPTQFTEDTARKFAEVREYLENQILTYA